jgi:hypothetical protein
MRYHLPESRFDAHGKDEERPEDVPGLEAGGYEKPADLDLALVGDDSSLPEREIL